MSELGEYSVSPNNVHLESSFRVPKEDFERELKAIREQYPESQVWNRSMESLKREWAAHNAFPHDGNFPESDCPYGLELAAAVDCAARVRNHRQGCMSVYLLIIDLLFPLCLQRTLT